jgi:hypothetical protein
MGEVMTNYTAEEVLEAASIASGEDPKEYDWTVLVDSDFWYSPEYYSLELRGESVKPVFVERTGGEGQGDYASVVFQVGTQFFRKEGYYASHYGYDWDGTFSEVSPVQKTITVYETKQ